MSTVKSPKVERSRVTPCVCPKCGTEYEIKIDFTGRGRMRRFCDTCRDNVSTLNTSSFHFGGIGMRRRSYD